MCLFFGAPSDGTVAYLENENTDRCTLILVAPSIDVTIIYKY